MNSIELRRAEPADLSTLIRIERDCFTDSRQSSTESLRRSLRSARQAVWLAEYVSAQGRTPLGALVLWGHRWTLRIYSIAVLPTAQGQGIGHRLLQHALQEARDARCRTVSLEADPRDRSLISWYKTHGFVEIQRLESYYSPGRDAIRMHYHVDT